MHILLLLIMIIEKFSLTKAQEENSTVIGWTLGVTGGIIIIVALCISLRICILKNTQSQRTCYPSPMVYVHQTGQLVNTFPYGSYPPSYPQSTLPSFNPDQPPPYSEAIKLASVNQ
ncbi:unnamed protein product [Didymodactylos carnosus]|uniref:Uncharacterized protein n=1 Tax=Didymodactylos carnosus TaxID=1234261 RepID=A0A814VY79_9BILA|nr:unnamed protein product [Didymodactylos carnosus]CAF3958710.1 unnamed protein product [Didymodactylos carnosus]